MSSDHHTASQQEPGRSTLDDETRMLALDDRVAMRLGHISDFGGDL
jgi:hypothetical protein